MRCIVSIDLLLKEETLRELSVLNDERDIFLRRNESKSFQATLSAQEDCIECIFPQDGFIICNEFLIHAPSVTSGSDSTGQISRISVRSIDSHGACRDNGMFCVSEERN